jgi:hypothetical protein
MAMTKKIWSKLKLLIYETNFESSIFNQGNGWTNYQIEQQVYWRFE